MFTLVLLKPKVTFKKLILNICPFLNLALMPVLRKVVNLTCCDRLNFVAITVPSPSKFSSLEISTLQKMIQNTFSKPEDDKVSCTQWSQLLLMNPNVQLQRQDQGTFNMLASGRTEGGEKCQVGVEVQSQELVFSSAAAIITQFCTLNHLSSANCGN